MANVSYDITRQSRSAAGTARTTPGIPGTTMTPSTPGLPSVSDTPSSVPGYQYAQNVPSTLRPGGAGATPPNLSKAAGGKGAGPSNRPQWLQNAQANYQAQSDYNGRRYGQFQQEQNQNRQHNRPQPGRDDGYQQPPPTSIPAPSIRPLPHPDINVDAGQLPPDVSGIPENSPLFKWEQERQRVLKEQEAYNQRMRDWGMLGIPESSPMFKWLQANPKPTDGGVSMPYQPSGDWHNGTSATLDAAGRPIVGSGDPAQWQIPVPETQQLPAPWQPVGGGNLQPLPYPSIPPGDWTQQGTYPMQPAPYQPLPPHYPVPTLPYQPTLSEALADSGQNIYWPSGGGLIG